MSDPTKPTVTLEQFFVIACFERVMAVSATEAGFLKALGKNDVAEKLESNMRHVAKLRDEYARSCQTGIVIARAGAIKNLEGGKLSP